MSELVFKFTKSSGREQHTTLDRVHYIAEISDAERTEMTDRYNQDTSDYRSSVHFFDAGRPMLAVETLDDFRHAGVALVDVGQGQHVPAATIGIIEDFTEEDAAELEARYGTPLRAVFKSRVNTASGKTYLAVRTPGDINRDKAQALAGSQAVVSPAANRG